MRSDDNRGFGALLRQALSRDARDLEVLNHRLRQLLGRLPASASRSEAEDLPEEVDDADELRGTLQCVLADHLEPAARTLRSAARPPRRRPAVLTADFTAIWQRVEARIGEEAKIFAEESREAPAWAAELLALPPRRRNRRLDAEPRFHSAALVQELIARARGELGRLRAERALPPLKAALRILRQRNLRQRAGGRELRAEALCELGEAWRRLGSARWAESCFSQAAQALRDSPDAMARALFCGRLARLRAGQRRLDEAVALFGRAAALWMEVGDREASAAAAAEQTGARRQLGEPAELPETARVFPAPARR
jgi:hypothetical protein